MHYTKETLTPINARYLAEHFINASDIDKVNMLTSRIEAEREEEIPVPHDGDQVICERPDGTVVVRRAHLEEASWLDDGELTVCVHPYVPYISPNARCGASGGPWFVVKPAELAYVSTDLKRFWTWGHMGACANGGIEFEARVNVWKIVGDSSRFV